MRNQPSSHAAVEPAADRIDLPAGLVVGGSWLAATLAIVAAAACCVLPLALTIVGLGGAWLTHLGLLARFEPILVGLALGALALAWGWLLWQRLRPGAGCGCLVPPGRASFVLLGGATALGLVALGRRWWEGPALQALWSVWTGA
jgi:mercuric ion transport protein